MFSTAISSLRRERGLSQRQAAAEFGISQALLSHYENGIREPKLDFIVRVCDFYGVSADYLLGRTDHRTNPMTALSVPREDVDRLMDCAALTVDAMEKSGVGEPAVGYLEAAVFKLTAGDRREQALCDSYMKRIEADLPEININNGKLDDLIHSVRGKIK